MAAIQYQPAADTLVSVTMSELQRELNDTWSQEQDTSGKAASLLRMEKEARRTGTNLQNVEEGIQALENFVTLVDQPAKLSMTRLEGVVEMLADGKSPAGWAVKDSGRMSELVVQLENLAEQMEETDRIAFRNLIVRLREYALRWKDGQKRIQALEQRWQDGMVSMRIFGELSRRRPLTTTERIRMLHASVIHTPVVQDPSDSREDWYEYDA
ncbi:MAG: hypothetical protein OXB89_04935 [Anaerolineaceae bacterium]|nr:hypothetical protein [Anaerolineaceae bacterium]